MKGKSTVDFAEKGESWAGGWLLVEFLRDFFFNIFIYDLSSVLLHLVPICMQAAQNLRGRCQCRTESKYPIGDLDDFVLLNFIWHFLFQVMQFGIRVSAMNHEFISTLNKRKNLSTWVNSKITMSYLCAMALQEAHKILECNSQSISSRNKQVFTLLCKIQDEVTCALYMAVVIPLKQDEFFYRERG